MKNQFKTQRFRIFKNENQIILSVEKNGLHIDIEELLPIINAFTGEQKENLKDYDISVIFMGELLTGSPELPNYNLYFGELNEDKSLKETKPLYYFSPKDKENALGRLLISYKNDELYLLNYSIKEKSLNIKLQCLNKQSLDYEALALKTLEAKEYKNIEAKQSKATLHALLENQDLKCIHGGKVILKSSKGKSFKDNNIPLILESDLLNLGIINNSQTSYYKKMFENTQLRKVI